MMVTLILISGSSGSGKSTITNQLAANLVAFNKSNNQKVHTLPQDNYFTAKFLPYRQRQDASFENGHGIDWNNLKMDIIRVSCGCVEKGGSNISGDADDADDEDDTIIIVEGHMLGAASSLFFGLFDETTTKESSKSLRIFLVFLQCPQEICKVRRLNRQNRSEQERFELATYIDTFVWPTFVEIGEPTMKSLRTHAKKEQIENNRDVSILELSTERSNSLEWNVQKITEAICK